MSDVPQAPTARSGGSSTPEFPSFPDGLEVMRPLGQGKMARVYLAREPVVDRTVAVKLLRPELSTDETARLRFEREARAASSLTHPNVVSVHRFGRMTDGTPYLVMTYVHGPTLFDHLQANGVMSEPETRLLLWQLASALAAAHRKGIVHRDVRTDNVLVDQESGRYLLTDFGIASLLDLSGPGKALTHTGQILGDPRCASPEQLSGQKVTEQADIYSLGVLAYEVLTGDGPYRAASRREALGAHLTGEPRPVSQLRAGISNDLEALLLRCLARQPSHRPSAQDVMKRLGSSADAAGVNGAEDTRVGIRSKRIPQIVSGTFAAGVALIGLAVGAIDIGRLPPVTFELTLNFVIWGLLASVVLAWFHGERGKQEVPAAEKWILAALATGWIAVTAVLLRP